VKGKYGAAPGRFLRRDRIRVVGEGVCGELAEAIELRSRETLDCEEEDLMIQLRVPGIRRALAVLAALAAILCAAGSLAAATNEPPLHGRKWVAITGKPLAATAGAMIFQKGGNAVDAAAGMIAAACTMWDTLSWGGETQALIYNPHTGKVIGINAL